MDTVKISVWKIVKLEVVEGEKWLHLRKGLMDKKVLITTKLPDEYFKVCSED
jgi:expansin (peptidoglycan-binding protein)